jgi:hypothetical protein
MAQEVEGLPSKHKALSSTPNITKRKKLISSKRFFCKLWRVDNQSCPFLDTLGPGHVKTLGPPPRGPSASLIREQAHED